MDDTTVDKLVTEAKKGGLEWLSDYIIGGLISLPFISYFFKKSNITFDDILGLLPTSWYDQIMQWIDSEGVAARQGINQRIETSKAYTTIEQRYEIPGLGDELKKLVLAHVKETVGYNATSIDPVENSKALYIKVNKLMEKKLRDHPDFKATPEQIAQLKRDAQDIAAYISGIPQEIDPEFLAPHHLTSGYGALLRQTQEGIAREGEYTREEVPDIAFNADLLAQVRVAAAPAASQASGGQSVSDSGAQAGLPPKPQPDGAQLAAG